FEMSDDVPGGGFADGDDFVLAAGESRDNVAAVEHAGAVVFARDMKRREVVDRGDERARFAPEHAAITRHVEDVQSMPVRETRQRGLMPEDVLYSRAITFRDA